MKVLLDLNVLLDVFAQRHPHYAASARLLTLGIEGRIHALIPAHAPATFHYLAVKSIGRQRANEALDWMLDRFEVVPATREVYLRARAMDFTDYEDAVVAAMAQASDCRCIATRNVADFIHSSVRAAEPAQLLEELARD